MSDDTLLATLEQRVRSLVTARLRTIVTEYGVYLLSAIKQHPQASATEILSQPAVHTALTTTLSAAHSSVESTIRAGYTAAARAGIHTATADTAALGHTTADIGTPTAYLDTILGDLRRAFDTARLDITDSVRAAHDGTTGQAAPPARVLVSTEAVNRAVRRLGVRAGAAASVAVHRGYTEAQNAVYADLAAAHPTLNLLKRWEVTSANPCPACAALHGTAIAIDQQFDAAATDDPSTAPPAVHRDLHGPPRHPNCRCRLSLQPSPASTALRAEVAKPTPGQATYLSAAAVRQMPTDQYELLTRFLAAALARVQRLAKEIRGGG